MLRLSGGDEKSGVAGVAELDIAWREGLSCGHFCLQWKRQWPTIT